MLSNSVTCKPFAFLFAALFFLLAMVLPSQVRPVRANRPVGVQLSSNSERDSKPGQGSRQQPGSATTVNWTNLFPELKAVSAVSSTEACAAGEQGHLEHYVDGHWVSIDTPAWDRLLLTDIKMLSANSGFLASYSL